MQLIFFTCAKSVRPLKDVLPLAFITSACKRDLFGLIRPTRLMVSSKSATFERERESRGEKVEETKTQSGIDGWHLGVPTWAEGAKPSYMKSRRKTVLCEQWLDARKDRKAPEGAPPWWGCPRGRGCDFAHGKVRARESGDAVLVYLR